MSDTARPSYSDLLKHPEWQRKRLEILDRAGFECEDCGDKTTTLHVHHGYYEKGLKPWEYPDESLHCLCAPCHEREQQKLARLHRLIGLMPGDLDILIGVVLARTVEDVSQWDVPFPVDSYEAAIGIGQVYHLNADAVISTVINGVTTVALLLSKSQDIALAREERYEALRLTQEEAR